MTPILYGAPLSPFVRKVAVALEEKAIAFEWIPVRPHDRLEAFARISPLGKIPAYKDDHVALADSSVICFYLEKTHPEKPLYPTDTLELVHALWFEEYFDGGMIKPLSTIYFETWMNPLLGKPVDTAAIKAAKEAAAPMFDYLESELKPNEWMVGNTFSIADISVAGGFLNMKLIDFAIDPKRYPKLAAYVGRALERPSFKKCEVFMQSFIKQMKEKLAAKG